MSEAMSKLLNFMLNKLELRTFPIALGIIGLFIIGFGVQIYLAKSDLLILSILLFIGIFFICAATWLWYWDREFRHRYGCHD